MDKQELIFGKDIDKKFKDTLKNETFYLILPSPIINKNLYTYTTKIGNRVEFRYDS